MEKKVAIGSMIATAVFFAIVIISAIHQQNVHAEFLRTHGCQLLTEAPTGRQVYCGKACYRPEHVYVYECVDGTRTEVH